MTPASGIEGTPLVPGEASGPVLALDEPLSFWGGLEPETGLIIDRRHPQLGACVTGAVLVSCSLVFPDRGAADHAHG